MAEIFGAVAASFGLLGQAITVVQKINDARSQLKGTSETLDSYSKQLDTVTAIVRLVDRDESLQTANVAVTLRAVIEAAEKLQDFLVKIQAQADRSSTRRLVHSLAKGESDDKELAALLGTLDRCKNDLAITIQLASVGLIRDTNQNLQAALPLIRRTNADVEMVLGIGQGLKIASRLKSKALPQGSSDGRVPLTREDTEALGLENDAKQQGEWRSWKNNLAYNQSQIIQGDVGERLWKQSASRRSWTDNIADKDSTIIQGDIEDKTAASELVKNMFGKRK